MEFLCSFDQVDESMINKHLDDWKTHKPKSLQDLLFAMLDSIKNRQSMPNTIGKINKLRPCLEGFDPIKVVEKYDSDWKEMFRTIQHNCTPPGRMDINNSRTYWVIFCKSIISASHFLSEFSSKEEFDNFVSQFYLNEYTRLSLPLLLGKEIYGMGFALACDFLKENGYPKFVKPDGHIIAIFYEIGISKSDYDYDVFKDVIRFSETINELPYRVDKLFWLVGSGYFYLDKVKIGKNRNKFIRKIKRELGNEL